MGLFDGMKKRNEFKKKAGWKQGLLDTILELNEDHMKLTTQTTTDIVFYKDIITVQQAPYVVNIKTNVKTFSLIAKDKRKGDKSPELQMQLLEKMNQNK